MSEHGVSSGIRAEPGTDEPMMSIIKSFGEMVEEAGAEGWMEENMSSSKRAMSAWPERKGPPPMPRSARVPS